MAKDLTRCDHCGGEPEIELTNISFCIACYDEFFSCPTCDGWVDVETEECQSCAVEPIRYLTPPELKTSQPTTKQCKLEE